MQFADFCSAGSDVKKPDIKKDLKSGPDPTQLSICITRTKRGGDAFVVTGKGESIMDGAVLAVDSYSESKTFLNRLVHLSAEAQIKKLNLLSPTLMLSLV
ncbi:hypothetical protein OS493_019829 [Desmophyllum pertusum]|uniref:Uncharacterized protein n=1 Tax=Desmophyllum pertusum TaxID=174260 RepID=A0A9W9Z128_9CNID|nr:hypothetical protein OS493_019829 [Desmophyllum pertusum]